MKGLGEASEHLAELGRLGARLVLQRAVDEEVAAFLGRARYQRMPTATGSRNGTRPKAIQTAECEISIAMPQARNAAEHFVSRVILDTKAVVRTRPLEALILAAITGAYFFTSSTSFANPAVTLARTLSDTFAGIAPASVLPFVLAQVAGATLACAAVSFLWPKLADSAQVVVVPHEQEAKLSDGAANAGAKVRVLFLCTHNSARSQMAEGLLRLLGGERFEAYSAGTEATHVRPLAITAMREIGIDISGQESKTLERYLNEPFDKVITVCDQANEACPVFFRARERLHWSFPDPSKATGSDEEQLAVYRHVRDAIREHIDSELLGRAAPDG